MPETSSKDVPSAKYERPVGGRLWVRLENGEEWEATASDLRRFGFVEALAAYGLFDDKFTELVGRRDPTASPLNPLRYLVELSIVHPGLVKDADNAREWAPIAVMEEYLTQHREEFDALCRLRERGGDEDG